MSLQERRASLIETINSITDEWLIAHVELLLLTELAEREKKPELKPYTTEEVTAMVNESEEDYKAGRFITTDELVEEIKKWK